MRVTHRSSTRNYLKQMNRALENQQKTQYRLDSGNRFEKISDDVSSGIQAMKVQTEYYKAKEHYSNVKTIDETLTSAESAMTEINDALANVHTKILKALSDTSATNRDVLAKEISSIKNQIMQVANSKYAGQFLFSGSNNYGAPFTKNEDGKLQYNGIDVDEIQKRDDGTYFYNKDGMEVTIPLNEKVYMDIGLGIRMTGNQVDPQTGFDISYAGPDILGFGKDDDGISNNIFNLLDDLEKAVKQEPFDTTATGNLDTKLVKVTDEFRTNLTDIGAKTQFLDSMLNRLEQNANNLENKLGRLTGTDYVEESIHKSTNDMVINSIYQMGASVIPLSLMDFLR